MNRSILIVICDFLVSAMLSMMTGMVPGHVGGTGVGLDAPTTALLIAELKKQQLQLQETRAELQRAQRENFSEERQQQLLALAAELAATQVRQEKLEERMQFTPETSGKLTPAQLQERLEAELKKRYTERILLADTRADLEAERAGHRMTSEELARMQTAAAVTAQQLKERDTRLASTDTELTRVRTELSERVAALAAREAELSGAQSALDETRNLLTGARRDLSLATARAGEVENQARQLESSLSFTKGQLSLAERELAEARSLAERERRLAAARELERNEAERQLENLKKMLKNAVTDLSQTRRELTETREKAASTDRELAQVQTKAETAEARLEATRQQLSEAERKLRSDVLDRYSEAAVRLDFALTEKRLVIDQDVNATFFIPVVKIAGRTVVPAAFADLTGGTQSPLSYQKITRLDYRLSPTAAGDGAMESKQLASPLLVPPGEPRVGAFEVDAPGRVPLSLLTIDALKQRGVENLFLFKTSSFGKDSAELGGRCSIDFGTAEPYLYIRNTGRGTGSELRAEPGDFIMSREGDFVGVVVGIESFDLGRRQEAKCYVFPENFSWEDAVSIPVVLQPGQTYFDSFGNDVRRNNEVIDQLTQ